MMALDRNGILNMNGSLGLSDMDVGVVGIVSNWRPGISCRVLYKLLSSSELTA